MRLLRCLAAIVVTALIVRPGRADEPAGTPLAPPPAPSDVAATVWSSFGVELRWKTTGEGVDGFEIQQQCADGRFVRSSVVSATAVVFNHHARSPATDYTYQVRAFNAAGFSSPSPLISVHTPPLTVCIPHRSPCQRPTHRLRRRHARRSTSSGGEHQFFASSSRVAEFLISSSGRAHRMEPVCGRSTERSPTATGCSVILR